MKDTKNEIRGVVGVVQDITKRKELEDQINQKRKMEALGALAGGIAHDFNNILTAILGNAEMLSMQLPADNPLFRHVTEITKGVERATKLVKQILSFSRMKSTCLTPLKLTPIVQDALKMTRAALPTNVAIHQQL